MKKYFVAGFAISAISMPVTAIASQQVSHHEAVDYGMSYEHAKKVFGKHAVGCKLIGINSTCHGKITADRIRQSINVLHRFFMPVNPIIAYHYTQAKTTYSSPHYTTNSYHQSYYHRSYSYSSGGASGVPACASESGTNYSTGPSNTNPSSGATGRYQILPSTSAAYHCDMSTPAGQDACAGRIYRAAGASQWVGCGG